LLNIDSSPELAAALALSGLEGEGRDVVRVPEPSVAAWACPEATKKRHTTKAWKITTFLRLKIDK
jgi:hypothetical protein